MKSQNDEAAKRLEDFTARRPHTEISDDLAALLVERAALWKTLGVIGEIAEHNSFVASAVTPNERALVVLGQAFVSIQGHVLAAPGAS